MLKNFKFYIFLWLGLASVALVYQLTKPSRLAQLIQNNKQAKTIFKPDQGAMEQFKQLNDLNINTKLVESFKNTKRNDTEFCIDLEASQREQDLIMLTSLEHDLLNSDELSNFQVEAIRSRIFAIRDTYELPRYDFSERIEDLMAIRMLNMEEKDYFALSEHERDQLLYSLGGTRYLKRAYINEEYLGEARRPANAKELNALDREIERNLIWKSALTPTIEPLILNEEDQI